MKKLLKVYLISYGIESYKRNGIKLTIDNFGNFEAIYNKKGWFSTKEDLEDYLKNLISDCAVVVCLLGDDSIRNKYLEEELKISQSLNKKRMIIKINDSSREMPEIWKKDGISTYTEDSNDIKNALESLTMWITA